MVEISGFWLLDHDRFRVLGFCVLFCFRLESSDFDHQFWLSASKTRKNLADALGGLDLKC